VEVRKTEQMSAAVKVTTTFFRIKSPPQKI
jgi:hypothetical protein